MTRTFHAKSVGIGSSCGSLANACSWFLASIGCLAATHAAADEPAGTTSAAVAKHTSSATHRFVHAPHATVHCGPSEEYYATGRLNRGAPVEVYIETADGWSGIRPPEGSHDWIPADAVYLLPGGKVAEVSVDRVPAWVGADTVKNEKLLYQTELIKTQTVSILGEAYRGNDADRKLWFRIAPPAGEFRWVRTEHLGTDPIPKTPPPIASASKPSASKPTGSGVKKAAYQPPAKANESSESGKERSASGDAPAIDGQLVWSDEAEQVAKVDREIEREQQSAMQGAKRRANGKTRPDTSPSRDTADEKSTSKKPSSSPLSSLIRFSSTPEETPVQPPVQRTPVARPPKPVPRPVTGPESDAQYWQSMQRQSDQQQRAGRAPAGAMDNVLGLLGISVIDPSSETPTPMQPIPRAARPRGPRPIPRSMAYDSPSAVLQRYDPAAGSRLSHLPRPRGRYAPSSMGSEPYGDTAGAMASQSPRDSSLLSSILNSREPLWGNHQERGLLDAPSRPPVAAPAIETEAAPNGPFRTASYSSPSRSPSLPSESNDWEQPERFQSPPIQEALLQLTAIVSRPTREWQLNSIRDTAVFWIERGETPLVRGEARLLLDRIDRFESIRQRSLALGDTPSAAWSTQPSSQTGIQPNSYPSASAPSSAQPNQFSVSSASSVSYAPTAPYTEAVPQRIAESGGEMSGWLQSVHTSYPGQPEFALTDDAGNVLAYVRSTPGLNLRRYIQQPVTVFGTRGYIPNLAAKQILADRVVRLK